MTLAGLVNMSMMLMAAALFHNSGLTDIDQIDRAYEGLQTLISTTPRRSSGSAC